MVTLYGLKACDTCRKARQEIEKAGKKVQFIDVRDTPLGGDLLQGLVQEFGDRLINRRSTTWRDLSENERKAAPEALIARFPTVMKRPVIVSNGRMTLGWDAAARSLHLGN